MRSKWLASGLLALFLAGAIAGSGPAFAAIPTEPTAAVTVAPGDTTVDASGVNPVDVILAVNVTGDNIRPQPHTMWVNMSFSTNTGWKVSPTKINITWTLNANGGHEAQSILVTVTVPPKVSANVVGVFSASWTQENTVRFGTGQSANTTSQLHIRQIFSTTASFTNGSSQYSVRQGQDVSISMRVTNFGNGDAQYDAELRNAAELLPNDILLEGTRAEIIIQNGTGNITAVIHANPYAIAGSYSLQLRAIASGAGTPPPAGAFADLTAQLAVLPATPPPSNNNTTQPPPPDNNTTQPPPPPPPPPDNLQAFLDFIRTPVGIFIDAAAFLGVVGLLMMRRSRKRAKKERDANMAKRRGENAARVGGGPGPGGPPGPGPRPGVPGPAGPAPRPGGVPGRPLPPRPQQRGPPGGPAQRPGAPPSK